MLNNVFPSTRPKSWCGFLFGAMICSLVASSFSLVPQKFAQAADTIIPGGSAYEDNDGDGTVDRIVWTLDEGVATCVYEAADWVVDNQGSNNIITGITNTTCTGVDNVLVIEVTSTPGTTGGGTIPTNPIISYNSTLGVVPGSVTLAGGAMTDKLLVEVLDEAPPVITSFKYEDLSGDGTVDSIDLVFSEVIETTSVIAAEDLLLSNVGDFTGAAFGSSAVDQADNQATIVTVALGTPASVVDTHDDSATLALTTQNNFSLVDLVGNSISSLGVQSQATVVDIADPVLKTSSPADGATGANRTSNIVLTFSEEMDTAAMDLADEITLSRTGALTFVGAWSGSDSIYTINPDLTLTAGALHTVGFGDLISLSTEDSLGAAADVTFRTASSGTNSGGGSSTVPVVETSCTVISPNGGEIIGKDTVKNISWTSTGTGIDNLVIYHQSATNGPWNMIVAGTPNDGSYDWQVPSELSNASKIRIECRDSGAATLAADESDATFTIATNLANIDDPIVDSVLHTREAANFLLPAAFPVDSLVKLADDGDASTTVDSAVYYIGLDAKRHPFPSLAIYNSWYTDFSEVQIIDLATLADISLGSAVLVRPGTHWVKIQSDPKTYYVAPGYTLRWVEDEATAIMLGGENWNQNIIDIEPTFFARFTVGEKIMASDLVNSWPAGSLVKAPGQTDVWYTDANGRRMVSNSAIAANHFQTRFVKTLTGGWQNATQGLNIVGFEDSLFSEMLP